MATLGAAVAVLLGLSLAQVGATAATAAPISVHMGDSYSAGAGIAPAVPGSPSACSRSTLNWGQDIALARGYQITDASCSNAQTKDFAGSQASGIPPQLDALPASTKLVTLTVGGNDSNTFSSAIYGCIAAASRTSGKGSPCKDTYGSTFENTIRNSTYPSIVKVLLAVKQKAPNARVAVSSYLPILPASQGCYPTMPIAAGDVAYLNGIEAVLNDAVMRAATATKVTFVDQGPAAAGHDACQPAAVRWVEPVNGASGAWAAHPNKVGEQAMANRTIAVLGL